MKSGILTASSINRNIIGYEHDTRDVSHSMTGHDGIAALDQGT